MPPATLLGVEHEYQLDPLRGPIDFRQIIHSLGIDGARLDPGDVHAYRLRSGAVLTADGVTAEVATPPVPFAPDVADRLLDLQHAGLEELTRVLPDGTPLFGYSTHISVSVPDHLNDELCALYARTFGPALMFQMNSIRTEGIYIRPRPGRIEFCGNYCADDRLRAATTFAASSVAACLAQLEGSSTALSALPNALEVVTGPDPIRYGLHLSSDSFTAGDSSRDHDLLLHSPDGDLTLGDLLGRCWAAAEPFLPNNTSAGLPTNDSPEDFNAARSSDPAAPATPRPQTPTTSAAVLERPTLAEPLAVYGAILEQVVRPRFGVTAAVAVWDFAAFQIAADARTAYVCVPRAELPAFWTELTSGARDRQIEAFLQTEARRRLLQTHGQTRAFGLWDDLAISQRLLSSERLPAPHLARADADSDISADSAGTSAGPRRATDGDAAGNASSSGTGTNESEARPGKRPRISLPGQSGVGAPDEPGDGQTSGRPGKPPPLIDPGRLGKIPLESAPLISIPSPFRRLWPFGLLVALLVVVVIVALSSVLGGSESETPATTTAATETQTTVPAAAPPVVGPITALLQAPTTTYSVEATSPDGLTLTYRWTLVADPGEDCGTITPTDAGVATEGRPFVQWSHANESPDDCSHDAADHPFNIEVEVSDGVNDPVIRTYRGSESGTGPAG